ncbi:MAG: hypothetical protein GY719_30520 [bacterium]|nr:hypothetical protein [bacterium]
MSAGTTLTSLILPEVPRDFPGRRGLKILLRGLHVLAVAVLVGGSVLQVEAEQLRVWLIGALVTGVLIFLLDLHESGAFLLQIRGLVVLGKIGLLAALPWLGSWRSWLLATLVVVSVLSSHAPSRVRYFMVAGSGKIPGGRSKG